jgi:hypothetical protein
MSLDNLTKDELIELLGRRASRREALAEVRHRVSKLGDKVNFLMFRYLCPQEVEDREDAWEGLVACCWKAKGNCYALPQYAEGFHAATHNFLEAALGKITAGYRRQSYKRIADLALDGKLRWAARTVRNMLVDQIRKTCARNRCAEASEEKIDQSIIPQYAKFLAKKIEREKVALVAAIGERAFVTLAIIADGYPFGRTRRERKGNMVRAITSARGVSVRQARRDVQALLEAVDGSSNWTARRAIQHLLGKHPQCPFRKFPYE